MNLIPAIRSIEEQVSEIKFKHQEELQPYLDSLENLKKINTACEKCGGCGKVFRRACAEDEGDYYTCDDCHGTGERPRFIKEAPNEQH